VNLEFPVRLFVAAVGGRHRYTSGEEDESTPFLGLEVGRSFIVWQHLDVGVEVRGQRMSGYERTRTVLDGDIAWTRLVPHDAEYLLVIALSLGGVL